MPGKEGLVGGSVSVRPRPLPLPPPPPFLSQLIGGSPLASTWHFAGDDKMFERSDLEFVFLSFFFPPRCPSLSRALGPQRSDDALDVFFRNLEKKIKIKQNHTHLQSYKSTYA